MLLLQIFKTMEKSEFRVLIKHCFPMEKKQFKKRSGLIRVIRTLLCRKQRLRGGMLTLKSVVETQMMLNAQVAQIRLLSRKTQKKIILADRKLKLRKIAEELKISNGRVFAILYEHLSMRKLFSK